MSTATYFVSPRVPLVDPQTGIINAIWYNLFSVKLFSDAGAGAVPDPDAPSIAPADDLSPAISALLAQDDVSPAQQPFPTPANDVTPALQTGIQIPDDVTPRCACCDEIAMLKAAIDDLKKGMI